MHRGIIGLRNRLIHIGNRPLENGMVAAGRPKMHVILIGFARIIKILIWNMLFYPIFECIIFFPNSFI